MEPIGIVDVSIEAPKYDLNFVADNYQRYFKYENRAKGEDKKQIQWWRSAYWWQYKQHEKSH